MGLWTELEVTHAIGAAIEAAAAAGIDAAGAQPIRSAGSILVDLPAAGLIARVERPDALDHARRQVDVARFCASRGAPVVRVAGPPDQPIALPGGVVMFLERLPSVSAPLTAREHGALLRELHDTTREPPAGSAPPFDPFRLLWEWLEKASVPGLEHDLEEVARRAAALSARWEEIVARDPLGEALIHGDPHVDNVIVTADGPVLVDLESSGVGPASWDLAVLAVGVRRYGTPRDSWQELLSAYGAEPAGPSFDAMCAVYELEVIAWAAASGDRAPRLAAEARLRLDVLLGRSTRTWTLL